MPNKLSKFAEFWMSPAEYQQYNQGEEDAEIKRKAREILEKARAESGQAINKYNAATESMTIAEAAGPDAWATARPEDIQKISEGQVLNERYKDNPMALARSFGLTANQSEEAKSFVEGLKKESDITGKSNKVDMKFKAQMEKDTPETKSRALSLLDKLQESNAYPNVDWDVWKNRITDNFDGAFQFNKVFTVGQTATDEALRKENIMRPAKAATSAATSSAGTAAKIRTEKSEGRPLTAAAAAGLGDFGASMLQMDTLLVGINTPDQPQGPIEQWKKINPYDWKAQGKQQLIAATKQLVGKALEGGVLRKEDEAKYEKILPTMGDTYESAVLKSQNLTTMLNNAYIAKRQSYADATFDVSRFPETLMSSPVKKRTGGPKVGDIVDGYRYKGGSPASPNSWEAVR